ncbi:biopolymer transport protein ExbB [Pedobacter sp. UYP30]|uniref:MotA/TolQ/ExbB proton channel family protein n=1 Tax=Pedobacter sp. UYP30 TaxID=1756400 RepID=UPI003397D64B
MTTLLIIQDTARVLQDSLNAVNSNLSQPAPELHFIDLLFKGGWVMLPLGLLAFLGLVIFVERYITIKKSTKEEVNLTGQVKQYILSGNLDGALAMLRNNQSPLSRMLQKGLKRIGRPIKDIEAAIENVGKLEVSKLEKNISILGIIAGIAPMLGFVGTIIGVITIFHDVSIKGAIEIGTISGGLYIKMISSATGLIIGIIAYVLYHILNAMVERIVLRMETDSIDFIDLLEEPSK